MRIVPATQADMKELSDLSVAVRNIPFHSDQCVAAMLLDDNDVLCGFAAAHSAVHAAGSWVRPDLRRHGHSYELRKCLESEMRTLKIPVYFAIPGTDFERRLFAKYGPVTEKVVQIRKL